jgi:hypothetical protein
MLQQHSKQCQQVKVNVWTASAHTTHTSGLLKVRHYIQNSNAAVSAMKCLALNEKAGCRTWIFLVKMPNSLSGAASSYHK